MRCVKLTGVVGAALLSIAVAACSVEGETATRSAAPTESTPISSPSSETPAPEASPVEDVAWANAVALIQASVAEGYDTARKYVSPGSIAEKYLDYHEGFREAHKVNGAELDPYEATAKPNDEARTIQITDDAPGSGKPLHDFKHDNAGLITSWSGTKPLDATIAPDSPPGKGLGQTVTLIGASAQRDGDLLRGRRDRCREERLRLSLIHI